MFGASDAWAGYTFTTFDVSTQLGGLLGFTNATGVNNAGQVVGFIGPANNAGASVSPSGSNGYDGSLITAALSHKSTCRVPSLRRRSVGDQQQRADHRNIHRLRPRHTHGFVTSGTAYTNPTNYTQLDAPSATVGNSIGITNAFGLNIRGRWLRHRERQRIERFQL